MNTDYSELLAKLEKRFINNIHRHKSIDWRLVNNTLFTNTQYLETLSLMESTGGEPDIIGNVDNEGYCFVFDCSQETPLGRRSLCYDNEALLKRKDSKPSSSVIEAANKIGIDLLNEEQYRLLQGFGLFDEKTSSWIQTPKEVRILGGALFCDRRYNRVFTYHNGAESYYSSRVFRGLLKIKLGKII